MLQKLFRSVIWSCITGQMKHIFKEFNLYQTQCFWVKFKATAHKHIQKGMQWLSLKYLIENNKNHLANSIECPKNEVNTRLPQKSDSVMLKVILRWSLYMWSALSFFLLLSNSHSLSSDCEVLYYRKSIRYLLTTS